MTIDDFVVLRRNALLERYDFIRNRDYADRVEWIPLFHAFGRAGGPIEPAVYDTLEAEFFTALDSAGPLDALLLDIHGAMGVLGRTGCEDMFVQEVRSRLGDEILIGAAMDPHGNVPTDFVRQLDLLTVHRQSPHEDHWLTRSRTARDLVECLESGRRPVVVWVDVPVLLCGELTSTVVEPGKRVFGLTYDVETRCGVLDAGLWIGFAWADEPRCRAAAVVTGFEEDALQEGALELARAYWDARAEFTVVAPASGSAVGAIEHAIASTESPVFISDSGDNITAGGSGDTTELLAAALKSESRRTSPKKLFFAGMYDEESLKQCVQAGVGGRVSLELGARLDSRAQGPVSVDAVVVDLRELPNGTSAAIIDAGNVRVAVADRRQWFITDDQWQEAGQRPEDYDVVIVKNGYLFPDQQRIANDWYMAITRGSTDVEMTRLDYKNVQRPLFPFDRDMQTPDFTAVILADRRNVPLGRSAGRGAAVA